jgi:hypothetical protein
MNNCFFCGPTDAILTQEHIWPQWVSRLLQGRHGSDHFRNLLSGPNSTTRNRASHIIDVTSSEVCLDCNTRWLSGIENAIKPLITPMITGDEAITLSADNQSTIAAWAYKMAMLLEVPAVGNRDPYFTPAERLQFRQTSLAHPYVKVFLARYAFGQHPGFAMDQRHTFTERSTGTARLLKVATMTVGHLAMQLMAVRSTASGELVPASEMEFEFLGKARRAVLQIWPTNPLGVSWPPELTMDGQDLEEWVNMWVDPEQPEYTEKPAR